MNLEKAVEVLDQMRLPNGAYIASPSKDYHYVWIRDVFYSTLPFMNTPSERFENAYHALFDLFKRYEWKIDIHTKNKPTFLYEYIHARYSVDLEEMDVEWGHAQNDAIGAFLWGVGEGIRHGQKVIRDKDDLKIIQKLVQYLQCLEYWHASDNGMWEENMELHSSSIGACVAGLNAVKMLVEVDPPLISRGEETLRFMLPRESVTKEVDLALLSLIFPYRIVDRSTALIIIENVVNGLERSNGCIRYHHDQYYNEGSEAEWCFGFPWLGLCYLELGMFHKAQEYRMKTERLLSESWEIPELYVGGSGVPNGNTPLAWAVSLSYLFLKQMKNIDTTINTSYHASNNE